MRGTSDTWGLLSKAQPVKNSVRKMQNLILQRSSACYAPGIPPHERQATGGLKRGTTVDDRTEVDVY
jgi:hypothetical protein